VVGKEADRPLRRGRQASQARTELRESAGLGTLNQRNKNIVKNANLRMIEPIGTRNKEVDDALQYTTAPARRAIFHGCIQLGNQFGRGGRFHSWRNSVGETSCSKSEISRQRI
jgi:hypothetical protein